MIGESNCLLRLRRKTPDEIVQLVDRTKSLFTTGRLKPRFKLAAHSQAPLLENPFFVVGCGRSGNTLLRRIFSQHPSVFIPPEMPVLGNLVRTFRRHANLDWEPLVAAVVSELRRALDTPLPVKGHDGGRIETTRGAELGISLNSVFEKARVLPQERRNLACLIDLLYREYGLAHFPGKPLWGDKTPWNVFHLQRISKVFPRARYIFLVRDGRDCVSSYMQSLGYGEREAAFRWRDANKICLKFFKEMPAERWVHVRYEDLVTDPEKTCRAICAFLGIEFFADMIASNQDVYLGDTVAAHHASVGRSINTRSIGRWKERLSQEQLTAVTPIIDKTMQVLGY